MVHDSSHTVEHEIWYIVKHVLRDHSRDQKMWSLEAGGLLTQVNYRE